MELNASVRYLHGVGPKRAELFAGMGVTTIEDLLYYFPRRYEDRTRFASIAELKEGEVYTIKAEVLVKGQRAALRRRGFSITEAVVADESGKVHCVWFNQPYLEAYLKVGVELILYGKVERYTTRLQMENPDFEIISDEKDALLHIGRIVPVYSITQGITQRSLRRLVKDALDETAGRVKEFLPYDIRSRNGLLNLPKSLLNIHFPENLDLQQQAFRRLSFEEFLIFELPLALRKIHRQDQPGLAHTVKGKLVGRFISNLPFELTESQQKVIEEIKADMAKPRNMHRLLQGDVGCGKTVVATVATVMAIQGGYQAAFLVPTEILAKQHFEKISSQFTVSATRRGGSATFCGGHSSQKELARIALLTSSTDVKEKEKIYQDIREGRVDLVIGTHALLEEKVVFKNLGLVVIDEQHKFGVGQRALLPQKGPNPDVLIMTATPIPRTLAITLYGDLDISVITELPAGRKPIRTQWIKSAQRNWLYDVMRAQLKEGRQAYIVYPVIEESYRLDLLSAKKMYGDLKENVFQEFKVGLIHGRLKPKEQDKTMSEFKAGTIQILVATTVLEVGIDVANASVMVIEQAERFGLSQLHQLRGRIGRGAYESYCMLVSDADSPEATGRLEAMVKYSDGFRIAEEDLRIRGPGEFFGRRQHGLTELKIANPLTQMHLLKKSREEALRLISLDPSLSQEQNVLLREKLLQRFPEYDRLMMVG